ncbi:scarecrow-like protein 9 [Zingiber officinale]|nr:scarecrow-like protein 9 [Zingiber officinale]XP_042378682.1 scarecrow-like protein 9 [Zingiber officinale]
MGTGIPDVVSVSCELNHDHLYADQVTANGFILEGAPTTAISQVLEASTSPVAISDLTTDSSAPSSQGTSAAIVDTDFNYDHLSLEENTLNILELGGLSHFYEQSGYLTVSDIHPGFTPSDSAPNSDLPATLSRVAEVDSFEDSEIFSDILLKDIDKMLMEENINDKFITYPEHPALLAAEQPFYEILGDEFSLLTDQSSLLSSHFSNCPTDSITKPHGSFSDRTLFENSWTSDYIDYSLLQTNPSLDGYSSQYSLSNNCFCNFVNMVEGTLVGTLGIPDFLNMSQPAWEFERGVEEAKKFLPSDDQLVINQETNGFCLPLPTIEKQKLIEVQEEAAEKEKFNHLSRGRKKHDGEDLDLEEGRNSKQSAVFSDETHRTEMLDEILLCNGEKCAKRVDELRLKLQNEVSKISHSGHQKGSNGGKGRGKKNSKRNVIDLTTLLVHCAQAAATDDRRTANELLKQIRQHSSLNGNANQRLAHWFADGLEARLAGTGSLFYHQLVAKRHQVTEILKAYQLYLAACPFKKISHFFSAQTILNVSEKAEKLHIIDFGIYYGFQWPCFMKRLSSRPGGPPKLKMTGIDVPVHGFRPTEVIDETGLRLTDYARSFKIPFEFHAIAANWETIKVEDFKIEKDEVVVVNCLYRLRNLMDETVVIDSHRDRVLNTIRKIKPDVFIHGVLNGTYNAPFFVTRFREALFHFSSLFDMIETNVPHEDEAKQLIEKVLFGRELINVISCEGTERVERPETYKQWQVRNLRAGLTQLPLNPDILKKAKNRVQSCYHKDFILDQDSHWLLQGWKGRIIFALSTWKTNSCC